MDKAKILVVDDEAALVDLIREWLEKGGYEVFSATDGLSGLREFFKHQPDLAILDVAMPAMTGFELCQRIREVSQVPVIMLTAKGPGARQSARDSTWERTNTWSSPWDGRNCWHASAPCCAAST